MEEGEIKYMGHNFKKAIKCLHMMKDTLPLFAKGASKFSDRDMAKKIILGNLSEQARVEFIMNGGNQLHKKFKIITLC